MLWLTSIVLPLNGKFGAFEAPTCMRRGDLHLAVFFFVSKLIHAILGLLCEPANCDIEDWRILRLRYRQRTGTWL